MLLEIFPIKWRLGTEEHVAGNPVISLKAAGLQLHDEKHSL